MGMLQALKGYPWMTEQEKGWYAAFINAMEGQLSGRGVAESPLLVLRVAMLADECIAVRRLQTRLHTEKKSKDAPEKTAHLKELSGDEGRLQRIWHQMDDRMLVAMTESVGKGWDRVRKGLNELDAYCTQVGTPAKQGLAAELEPLIMEIRALEAAESAEASEAALEPESAV